MKPPLLLFVLSAVPSLCDAWSVGQKSLVPGGALSPIRSVSSRPTSTRSFELLASPDPSALSSIIVDSASGYKTKAIKTVSAAISLMRGGAKAPDLDLQRVGFRLEGMEIYSLVMALFMGAALGLLGSTPIKISPLKECKKDKGKALDTLASYLFYVSSTYAVVSSAFTTILFTLVSLYAKTAIGMGTDVRYLQFLDATGHIRADGFFAFMRAIKTFGISFVLSTYLCTECGSKGRWIVPLLPTFAIFKYWGLLNELVDAAGRIIFAPMG